MSRARLLWALLVLILASPSARAHKPSDSYLRLGVPAAEGELLRLPLRWDLALRDLDRALDLDTNHDGAITWGEVRAADAAIRALLMARIEFHRGAARCALAFEESGPPQIVRHSDGTYALYSLALRCGGAGSSLKISYSLLFDLDAQHRGLLRSTGDAVTILSRAQREAEVPLPAAIAARGRLWAAILEGVHHIWTGYDHLLFLLALLLPAVLRRQAGQWTPTERVGPVLIEVLKVVSAFTAAHSVTLSLAALGALALPSRLVEASIALSVVLAALNNLWPLVRADRWLAAFALGLLHGFGFSSTLADLGLSRASLVPTLVGFNLGVELGQAAVVALFVPLAFAARRRAIYRRGALQLGSALIALVAAAWFFERALDLVIWPR